MFTSALNSHLPLPWSSLVFQDSHEIALPAIIRPQTFMTAAAVAPQGSSLSAGITQASSIVISSSVLSARVLVLSPLSTTPWTEAHDQVGA